MRSPAEMQTIQIDITNACNKKCSNCTRFCGNHRKPFFMDFETFCRAVDSLEGYDGVMGIMGGEPTLHPEFERFVLYAREKFQRKSSKRLLYPQKEFIKEIRRQEFSSHILRTRGDGSKNFKMYGLGLFSNMGESYRKHYEMIQDSFHMQYLNDHLNSSYHQPGLFSRKDLGIPDEEWIRLRDKCWIQNEWSATITPKGAFFCEIAGALDMLFDGSGGWNIEKDWWRRTPEEFGDQLHWCEICGFALNTFQRDAEEETDDVSPSLYEMLAKADSPRLKAGKTHLVKIEKGKISEESRPARKRVSAALPYFEHFEDRFCEKNSLLYVRNYRKARILEGKDFGQKLNRELSKAEEWVLLIVEEDASEAEVQEYMTKHILNPGVLHLGEGFALFSKRARSLRMLGFDRIAHASSFNELTVAWQPEKVVRLSEVREKMQWRCSGVEQGKRYALWGTGMSGSFLVDAVQSSGGILSLVVDKDPGKEGMDFYGLKIRKPQALADHEGDYDLLLIGHYSRFEEIQQEAIDMGIPAEKIMLPYEVKEC